MDALFKELVSDILNAVYDPAGEHATKIATYCKAINLEQPDMHKLFKIRMLFDYVHNNDLVRFESIKSFPAYTEITDRITV